MTTEYSPAGNDDFQVFDAPEGPRPPGRIPLWDSTGVIPPIRPGVAGHEVDRSPYEATLLDVVERFGTSRERRAILRGLLRLRAALHEIGIHGGFQWLDGSFFEHVENTRGRPPNDIDVVTFADLGDDDAQKATYEKAPELFDHAGVKTKYLVDHYYVGLGYAMDRSSVRATGYWYSMWSHRREDHLWKWFVELDLDISGDLSARDALDRLEGSEGLT